MSVDIDACFDSQCYCGFACVTVNLLIWTFTILVDLLVFILHVNVDPVEQYEQLPMVSKRQYFHWNGSVFLVIPKS